MNTPHVRFDAQKLLPSGCSPNESWENPSKFGGKDCLIPISVDLIDGMIQELGGEELLQFVSREWSDFCASIYENDLGAPAITFQNV